MLTYNGSPLKTSALGAAIFVGTLSASSAFAQTKNAQSIMATITVPTTTAVDGTKHYDYDANAAANLFTNLWDTNPPTCSGSNSQCDVTPPAPPTPSSSELLKFVNAKATQCTLLDGAPSLSGGTYVQKSGRFTYTYVISPKSTVPVPVPELTAWVLDPDDNADGTAIVTINAHIAGESVISSKQHPLKFSFSLDNGTDLTGSPISRVTDLKYVVSEVNGTTETPVGADIFPNHSLAFNSAASPVNFHYQANAGDFGTISLLQNGDARSILNGLTSPADTFPGNDNGGTDGKALALANVQPIELELPPSMGSYKVALSGVIKGNPTTGTESDRTFNVTGGLTVIGRGCGIMK